MITKYVQGNIVAGAGGNIIANNLSDMQVYTKTVAMTAFHFSINSALTPHTENNQYNDYPIVKFDNGVKIIDVMSVIFEDDNRHVLRTSNVKVTIRYELGISELTLSVKNAGTTIPQGSSLKVIVLTEGV